MAGASGSGASGTAVVVPATAGRGITWISGFSGGVPSGTAGNSTSASPAMAGARARENAVTKVGASLRRGCLGGRR